MSSAAWSDVWSLILILMAHQSVPVNLLAVLATAFLFTMSLEGIRSSFFTRRARPVSAVAPVRTIEEHEPMDEESSGERHAAISDETDAPGETAEAVPAYIPYGPEPSLSFNMVNATSPRRSNPRQPRAWRMRKPSGENFI